MPGLRGFTLKTDKNGPAGYSGIRVCQRIRDFARISPRVSGGWSDEETVLSAVQSPTNIANKARTTK